MSNRKVAFEVILTGAEAQMQIPRCPQTLRFKSETIIKASISGVCQVTLQAASILEALRSILAMEDRTFERPQQWTIVSSLLFH